MLPLPVVPPAVALPRDAVAALARSVRSTNLRGPSATAPTGAEPPASAEDRAAWLVGLRQIVDAAEATFTAVLADFDAAGDGEVLHAAASTQAWLRGALGMAAGDAAERVRLARASRDLLDGPLQQLLPNIEQPHEPAPNDRISFEQIKVIARTVRSLPPSSHHDAVTALTQIATQVNVDHLRNAARHLKQVIDPDGSLRQAETDFQRRWLTVAPMLDGLHAIEGVLDAESAALLNTALAPFAVPTGADDQRTAAHRRADGLTEIVAAAIKSEGLPTLSGSGSALQVQVELATLIAADVGPAQAGMGPAQIVPPNSTSPTGIAQPTLHRISCDATVRRIVLDPSGVPVELGRQVRLYTAHQRQALAQRDYGCRFPGCDRAARHTDAHHLVSWTAGGETTLPNGLLLCRYHHRQVHEGGWQIQPAQLELGANGSLSFLGPDGQRLTSALPRPPTVRPTPVRPAPGPSP